MKKYILSTITLLFPLISFAQPLTGLGGLMIAFKGILNSLVPVIFGLATIYFLWGVTQFILNDAGNDKTREEGKKKIIWGIVALFVFVSIYGILSTFGDLIGIEVPSSDSPSSSIQNNSFSVDGEDM